MIATVLDDFNTVDVIIIALIFGLALFLIIRHDPTK